MAIMRIQELINVFRIFVEETGEIGLRCDVMLRES
jgi:hypothetical protein